MQYAHIAVTFACKKKIPMDKCDSYICMLQMNPPLFKVKGGESVCIIFQARGVHFKNVLQTDTLYNVKLKYVKKVWPYILYSVYKKIFCTSNAFSKMSNGHTKCRSWHVFSTLPSLPHLFVCLFVYFVFASLFNTTPQYLKVW